MNNLIKYFHAALIEICVSSLDSVMTEASSIGCAVQVFQGCSEAYAASSNNQGLAPLMSGFLNHWWPLTEPLMRCGRPSLFLLAFHPSVHPKTTSTARHASYSTDCLSCLNSGSIGLLTKMI